MTEILSDSHNPAQNEAIVSGSVDPTIPGYGPEATFDNGWSGSPVRTGDIEPDHVPDGTFENTWQKPTNPTGEHTLSGVWSESGVTTGDKDEHVLLEQSDYATPILEPSESVPSEPDTQTQAPINENPPDEIEPVAAPEPRLEKLPEVPDPSAIEEMMATATKVQEAAVRPTATTSVAQEVSLSDEVVHNEADSQVEQPRWTIPRLPSRPAPMEQPFATVKPGAPESAHTVAALLNELFKGGLGSGPEKKKAPADPLDIYEPQYAEQLKSARSLINAEIATIDTFLSNTSAAGNNQWNQQADRRKQLFSILKQAEREASKDIGYDDDLDLYQVSLVQRNVQKRRDAAEKPFSDADITKMYGRNYERASQMNQPNAPQIDKATRQKYLAQERRAKIALLFRRQDGSFPF